MAVTFNSIQADVMAQLNALTSTSVTGAESTYNAAVAGTLGASDKTSTDWPVGMIQAAILDTEIAVIRAIAENEFHPERRDLYVASSNISSGSPLPKTEPLGTQYLGKISLFLETGTGNPVIERPLDVVKMVKANENSMFTVRPLIYAILGGTIIIHTSSTTITAYGVAADRFPSASFGTGEIRVKDYHRTPIVNGALAQLLLKEGAWLDAQQANFAKWNQHLASIASVGRTVAEPFPSQT